ncbi:MAG: hypothetical protein HY815_27165 [Candidatus Riflebacteria bacterium]|nr:hypothetical protein [Candidatus Riflebacteria bacterium]
MFVVGPDRDLCHLAVQFAVKGGARSILIGCPDRDARFLPVRDSHDIPVTGDGTSEETWYRAALQAARLILDLEKSPPRRRPSPFRRR